MTSLSDKRSPITDDPKAHLKSAPALVYRQLSRQHTEDVFQSLPWITNNGISEEINRIYEEANQLTSLRAFIAIYSGILVWIGCWNILHLELKDLIHRYIWHRSMEIGASIYGIIGILMMFYVGTLYDNAGFVGTWRQKEYYSNYLKIKVIFAYFGQFFYYICLFSYFDTIYDKEYHIKGTSDTMSSFIIDITMWTFGYIILLCTNTFWCIAGVSPPWYEGKTIDIYDPISKHIKFILMSCTVIFAYSIIWSTSSRFLENYSDGSVWRELFYTAAGLLLFIATGNFVANSAIWMDDDDEYDNILDDDDSHFGSSNVIINEKKSGGLFSIDELTDDDIDEAVNKLRPSPKGLDTVSNLYLRHKLMYDKMIDGDRKMTKKEKRKQCRQFIVYYIRGFISLESQILHTTGSWTFLDTYFIEWSVWRDIGYVIFGLLGLYWSKALFMKACVTPFNVAGAHPDGLIKAIKRQDDFDRRRTL